MRSFIISIRFPIIIAIAVVFPVSAQAVQLQLKEISGKAASDVPVVFGHYFKKGDIAQNRGLTAKLSNGSALSAQFNPKSRHSDGSVRHCIITLQVPNISASEIKNVELSPAALSAETAPLQPADLLASSYDVMVNLRLSGKLYSASAKSALAASASPDIWLKGPLATEWLLNAPLVAADGQVHPHLRAQFHVRAFGGLKRVRTNVVVENVWAHVPNPSGFEYDTDITVAGKIVYAKQGLLHTRHARWNRVVWWGDEPAVHVLYDREYLFASGAVPRYDQRISISTTALQNLSSVPPDPMSNAELTSYMPMTGAHPDIGPLPRFAALYLLSMDPRAMANTLRNGQAGGSFQIHYRDQKTNLPVSLEDYPYMTILGRSSDTYNPQTRQYEAFPAVTNPLTVHTPDDAHQPSIAYLPYLITGDYFFLEELQFWANWNMVMANPGYREYRKGLLKWGQVRAQAWSLRTLGQAASMTPDDHPMKSYFVDRVGYNLEYYNSRYSNNANANKLGIIEEGGGLATPRPWMDDFVTWSAGHLVALGFEEAKPFLAFKAKFPVGRMTPPFCWLHAPMYAGTFTNGSGAVFSTFGEYYKANFSDVNCSGTVMDGYPANPDGYGANFQPALAVAVNAGVPGAKEAWAKYETRNPKQNYSSAPQWAAVPESISGIPTTATATHPAVFSLSAGLSAIQNAANSAVSIRFQPAEYNAELGALPPVFSIFDLRGRLVHRLEARLAARAGYEAQWSSAALSPGLYFVRCNWNRASYQTTVMIAE